MALDTALEMDSQRSSFWSRKLVILSVAAMIILLLIACIGGYCFGNAARTRSDEEHGSTSHWNRRPSSWFDAVCSTEISCPYSYARSPMILISLDGFAARYLHRNFTPSLQHLASCGARPTFMSSVFPTKTFANHYSIATGLYPSAHGIVDNTMYDPVFNKTFKITSPEAVNSSWWGGEPIWLTARRQGLKTASYFWPGSDVVGINAEYYKKYNKNTRFSDRVDQVLLWLDLPTGDRPDFITLYFEEPDLSGHRFGPDSKQLDEALQVIDGIISKLMEGLHARHLLGCINLVIVSDHGMSEVDCNRVVYLDKMVTSFTLEHDFFVGGAVGRLRPLDAEAATENAVLQLRDEFQCKSPHVWVYDVKESPVRWEFFGNRRIDPLLFDVDEKWLISANLKSTKYCNGGDHGYDNLNTNMSAIFIGSGPAFKMNYLAEPFSNIQVYSLLSEILGVEPAPNNGTKGALRELLRTTLPLKFVPKPIHTLEYCRPAANPTTWNGACPSTATKRVENFTVHRETISVDGIVLGIPIEIDSVNAHGCVLPNEQYVTGISRVTKSPLWTMFTFNTRKSQSYTEKNASEIEWLNDPRLIGYGDSPSCFRYQTDALRNEGISQVPLLPAFLDHRNLVTNAVPMYDGFHSGVWKQFWLKVLSWKNNICAANAVIGPMWIPRDSRSEIPTHYFVILTYAVQTDTTTESLSTFGFILPHRKSIPHCWDIDRYLKKHQASVETIEAKTGLRFYSDLPSAESLRLRLKLVQTPPPFPLV